ncbi:MAG: tetratricopeptide repeat protein [Verrucomicrobia bacterium]|mgnify:CR=1 FL=1|jgi:tetratricopeptide (TPR) repeat protein|nr:tetratricopeptide repeat protein [Verrucomicrobiota bacterium]MBT7065580.1 tetratricopeptide repeat protein [Verrucomicrobiota bacterium]MBT7701054.1 tetratricopeptide repeat protein [Verrucomicrobiota bacterium]
MAEVTKAEASQEAQALYNKGFSAFERGNLDFAIDLLQRCLEIEPAFLQARKFLRAAEIGRFKEKNLGAMARKMMAAKAMPALGTAMVQLNTGKVDRALVAFDKLLQDDPLNPKYALPFARAASAADIPEAGVQTLEIIREHHPSDATLFQSLGELYTKLGQSRQARECFERLCELRPKDADAVKLLKDSFARESIQGDGWEQASDEEGGSFRDMIRDGDEATRMEKESKAVKSDEDADSLIADMLAKIEAEPANVNYYRALARLYAQRKLFDEGVSTLRKAIEMNPGDPELDNTLSQMRMQQFEFEIEAVTQSGDTDALAAKQHERTEFEFHDVQEKVERYPNDLALRFRWGQLLHQNDYFNEAIQQFQLSQRSPKDRLNSLYYMGLCFKAKGQFDMARDQLEAANGELTTMDGVKKNVCYELGSLYESMGDKAKAAEYYKLIYQADISYKDISQKIESLYE